ncbi:hypothetical protein [Flavivirga sp. 57AJ16]|uniref:hypothetical protein n=1 Tax=Flavivirga sp. 57AJ16 TaxID=3025307 RepID=UPI0023651EC6|nr:hypothetical protein [Flavivirga sp. 57AJ16]MDD7887106.1 hypothetical protein [Flavivirga sp. 57AJ16]
MTWYKNLGGDSGIASYEIGADKITITFSTNVSYEYTYDSAGVDHIENMKSLAKNGQGLNSYINKYVKKRYSRIF